MSPWQVFHAIHVPTPQVQTGGRNSFTIVLVGTTTIAGVRINSRTCRTNRTGQLGDINAASDPRCILFILLERMERADRVGRRCFSSQLLSSARYDERTTRSGEVLAKWRISVRV